MAEDKIYRYGDVVALVVAEHKEPCPEAAKVKVEIESFRIQVTWTPLCRMPCVSMRTRPIYSPSSRYLRAWAEEPSKVQEVIDNSAYSVSGSFYSAASPTCRLRVPPFKPFDEDDNLTFL